MKEILSAKENVRVEISHFEHGFMNKKSKNFDSKAFKKYTKQILNEIEK